MGSVSRETLPIYYRNEVLKMSKKRYSFSECVKYAKKHNISFNFYYYAEDHLNYLYADISDAADGYCSNTQAVFEWDSFFKVYRGEMNLNVRYAYAKDYELMHRLQCAVNNGDAMTHIRATWNNGRNVWYGA